MSNDAIERMLDIDFENDIIIVYWQKRCYIVSLRDNWKQTGIGLGNAFRDLGKSIVKTVATGAKKADDWANREDKPAEKQEEDKQEEKQE